MSEKEFWNFLKNRCPIGQKSGVFSTKNASFWTLTHSFPMKMRSCNARQRVKLKLWEVTNPHLSTIGLGQKPTPDRPKPAAAEFTTIDVQARNGISRSAMKMISCNARQRVK